MDRLRQRMSREEGFTLIELLIVIVIIGILLAIAIPSYLGFRDRANKSAATSDVRSAIPSAEAFYSDNNNYFSTGGDMNTVALRAYDSGLRLDDVTLNTAKDKYCLTKTVGGHQASVIRPAITPGQTGDAETDKRLRGDVYLGACGTF